MQRLSGTLLQQQRARASRRGSINSLHECELLGKFARFPKIFNEDTQAFVRDYVAAVRVPLPTLCLFDYRASVA